MTAQGFSLRGWAIKLEGLIRFLVHLVIVGLFLALMAGLFISSLPAAWTITTRDTVPFLPARHEIVLDVTNVFKEFLQGGGVGLPQIERDMEAYAANASDEIHFLTVASARRQSSADDSNQTRVDYYDITGGKVFHTSYAYDSPVWTWNGITVGYYTPVSAGTEDGYLVVEREFGNEFGGTLFFLSLGGVFLYVMVLSTVVGKWGLNPFFQRLKKQALSRSK